MCLLYQLLGKKRVKVFSCSKGNSTAFRGNKFSTNTTTSVKNLIQIELTSKLPSCEQMYFENISYRRFLFNGFSDIS